MTHGGFSPEKIGFPWTTVDGNSQSHPIFGWLPGLVNLPKAIEHHHF